MCNLYRLEKPPAAIVDFVRELELGLTFPEGVPNFEPRDVRIAERAPLLRLGANGAPELVQRRWSWPGPSGKPVFNFRGEGRRFAPQERCVVLADGFYEFTTPEQLPGAPKPKRKDRWLFTWPPDRNGGHDWFGIAGILRADNSGNEAFALLTSPPGPDVAPYHDRQIVLLTPADIGRWLDPAVPAADLVHPLPGGTLDCRPANT
jgi:putative SOS response-associated peptidase YedK